MKLAKHTRRPSDRSRSHLLIEAVEARLLLSSYSFQNVAIFHNNTTGVHPTNLIADGSGNLFGTTQGGQFGFGAVFEIPVGTHTVTPLVQFSGSNGRYPGGLTVDSAGNVYGSAQAPSGGNDDEIFEILKGTNTAKILASNLPGAGNIFTIAVDSAGNLHAATQIGGANHLGSIIEVVKGSGVATTVYTFNGSNGQFPGGPIIDKNDNLFFASENTNFGPPGTDQVFEFAKGSNSPIVLATNLVAVGAIKLVLDSNGNVFGTTQYGGAINRGSIFEIRKNIKGAVTLASFNGTNGANPLGPIAIDAAGNFFGAGGGGIGHGQVFELTAGSSVITVIASFAYNSNGFSPVGVVLDSKGNLFGTNLGGGDFTGSAYGYGTVFELSPGGNSSTGSINGTVFKDINGNGARDATEPAVGGATVKLLVFQNGSYVLKTSTTSNATTGAYSFSGLAAGNYELQETLPAGLVFTSPSTGVQLLSLGSGDNENGINFGNADVTTASVSGNVYNDVNGNGSVKTPLSGWTVFVDLNGDGLLNVGEPSAITNSSGNYTISNLRAGTFKVQEVPPAGSLLAPESPVNGVSTVVIGVGKAVTGINFANRAAASNSFAISGLVFNDANGNGAFDAGEKGIANAFVFVGSTFTGNQPATFTDASGQFYFSGLTAGTYHITASAAGAIGNSTGAALSTNVTLPDTKGNHGVFVPLGQKAGTATISGMVFNDVNDNGKLDSGETGVANQTVFIDLNGDREPTQGEPTTVTDSTGHYTFSNLLPGTYPVRIYLPQHPGTVGLYPTSSQQVYAPSVTVAAGQTQTVNFGAKLSTGDLSKVALDFTLTSSVTQIDGKLIDVGYTGSVSADTAKSVIERFNPDGSLDHTFGNGTGKIVQTVGAHQSQALDVTIQPDGRFVVVGAYDINFGHNKLTNTSVIGTSKGYVYRYNINGTSDSSLQYLSAATTPGTGEDPNHPTAAGYSAAFSHVAISYDPAQSTFGDITVTGQGQRFDTALQPNTRYLSIYRFRSGGALDTSFAGLGFLDVAPFGSELVVTSVAFDSDGSFYLPQTASPPNSKNAFSLYHFATDGSYTVFPYLPVSKPGATDPTTSQLNATASAAAIGANGNIVIVGSVDGSSNGTDFAMMRINPVTHQPDLGFNKTGVQIVDFGGADVPDDVAIEPDGQILVTGHRVNGTTVYSVATLLNADGSIDTTFGSGGKFIGPATAASAYINSDFRFTLSRAGTPPATIKGTLSVFHPQNSDYGQSNGTQPGMSHPDRVLPRDSATPSATLYYAPPITIGGSSMYYFQVHIHDPHQLDLATLGNMNIQITGPTGTKVYARFGGLFGYSNTTTDAYAFFGMAPPGGSWSSADSGTYTISLLANQISNGTHYAPAGTMGTFAVTSPAASITGKITNGSAAPLLNHIVYIDLTNAGHYVIGDPTAISNASGIYSFFGLAAGNYTVRTYLAPGAMQISPSNGAGIPVSVSNTTVSNVNFTETF